MKSEAGKKSFVVMKWLRWDAGRIVYVDCREGDGG